MNPFKLFVLKIARWWWQRGTATAIYSADGKYYYITGMEPMARNWLSVEQIPGPVPREKREGGTFSGYTEIHCDDGRIYHRHVLPFAFYNVKSGAREQVRRNGDMFLDCASNSQRR